MISATAYFRDVFAGAATYISGATDGETWTVNAQLPDGSTITWNTITFYEDYNGSSNCFVSEDWGAVCGYTRVTVLWWAAVQCRPTGLWTMNFYNNSNYLFSAQFTLLPQIPPDKVPLYNQGDYSDAYDTICRTGTQKNVYYCDERDNEVPWTIAGKGCYMTDAVMILNYHGVSVDPPTLNTWLIDNSGYDENGNVYPGAIVRYAEEQGVSMAYPAPEPDPQQVWAELERLERFLCYYGPHLIGTKLNDKGLPRHWVTAIGRDADRTTYKVNDPNGGGTTTLAESYNNRFNGIRAFGGPQHTYTDRTGIIIRFHSPGELLLTDPQGRRIGYDPINGATYNEIPGAYYEAFYLEDAESGDPGPDTKELEFPRPLAGDYQLQVIGTDTGTYILEIRAIDPELNLSQEIFRDIPIAPGEVHAYGFYYAKTVGSEIEFTAIPGNFDGKGQRPKDVNKFLSYVTPTEATTELLAGTTKFSLIIIYDKNIIPTTFTAELNGIDVKSLFHPAQGNVETVTLNLIQGRNTLVLSVEGNLPDRIARDRDSLVFIVP